MAEAEPITVLPGAADEAAQAIEGFDDPALVRRMERAMSLAAGFESAYGLELLATVHWCATRLPDVDTAQAAAECVRSWNDRKSRLFTDDHVGAAWKQLVDQGWIEPASLTTV